MKTSGLPGGTRTALQANHSTPQHSSHEVASMLDMALLGRIFPGFFPGAQMVSPA